MKDIAESQIIQLKEAFTKALIWILTVQEDDGYWHTGLEYTSMVSFVLNKIGLHQFDRVLEKASAFLVSRQTKPGIFIHTTKGEPNLESVVAGLKGRLSTQHELSKNEINNCLTFIENWISTKGWGGVGNVNGTFAALQLLKVTDRTNKRIQRIQLTARDWIFEPENWEGGLWKEGNNTIEEQVRSTCQALLSISRIGESPKASLVQEGLYALEESIYNQNIWANNRNLSWVLLTLLYWGKSLNDEIVLNGVAHLIKNQNDDGSWSPKKGQPGNTYHTARILELLNILFHRHNMQVSLINIIDCEITNQMTKLKFDEQVNSNIKEANARKEDAESENRKLRLFLLILGIVAGVTSIALAILAIIVSIR